MKRIVTLTLTLIAALLITACAPTTTTTESPVSDTEAEDTVVHTVSDSESANATSDVDSVIDVVTTFDAITEYVTAVGGDRVSVRSLIPSGAAAHGFEPKAQDLVVLQDADLFVINGLEMEPWAERAVESVNNEKLVVVDTSEGVDTIAIADLDDHHGHDHDDHDHEETDHDHEHVDADHDDHDHDHDDVDHDHDHELDDHDHEDPHHGHDHGDYDPHIWLGLSTAKTQVENVRDALIAADAAGKDEYEANAKAFTDKLDALLAEYEPKFAAIDNKIFVTGHAAFSYLCRDLGLTQLSVQNVYADGEPSAKQLIDLVEFSREHDVKTIFAESLASPEVSRTLADEVGANVETIYTLEAAEDGMSYVERVEANLVAMLAALQK